MTKTEPSCTDEATDARPVSPWLAASLAASGFVVSFAMSASSAPALIHPTTFAWHLSLRQPWFKPHDALIPLAWTCLEAGLAVAACRLLRTPPS